MAETNEKLEVLKSYWKVKKKIILSVQNRFYFGIIESITEDEKSLFLVDRYKQKLMFNIDLIESIVPVTNGGKNDRS